MLCVALSGSRVPFPIGRSSRHHGIGPRKIRCVGCRHLTDVIGVDCVKSAMLNRFGYPTSLALRQLVSDSDARPLLLSKGAVSKLEISVTVGCGRMCSYCPQSLHVSQYRQMFGRAPSVLTLATIEQMGATIPSDIFISWTGFAEPLDGTEFGPMVEYFFRSGNRQEISTTLFGTRESIQYFVCNLDKFDRIILHLPDDGGHMKGRVDDKYLDNLSRLLAEGAKLGCLDRVTFLLAGSRFHISIETFLKKAVADQLVKRHQIKVMKVLLTRQASVDPNALGFSCRRAVKGTSRVDIHYCAYGRLNTGVLLPSGHVALCCMDYGLGGIRGSIHSSSISDVLGVMEDDPSRRAAFQAGVYKPCTSCEFYQPLPTRIEFIFSSFFSLLVFALNVLRQRIMTQGFYGYTAQDLTVTTN